MTQADREAFEKWLADRKDWQKFKVPPHYVGNIEEAWQAALEYERARRSPLDALSLYDKLEAERERS